MTPLEEFKAKVRAGEMFDALAIAMSEAIELNITTWVVSADRESDEDVSQPGYRMRTRIDLVEGKVDNEIGREFLSNPAYAELQQLHLEQVRQGREILLNNLASLQSMFAILNDTQPTISELPEKSETKSLPEG